MNFSFLFSITIKEAATFWLALPLAAEPLFPRIRRGLILWATVFTFCLAALETNATPSWTVRDVTAVDGRFSDIHPRFGFEQGIGTARLSWGDPTPGSFSSFLEWEGYDRFPNFDQPWFFGGQSVRPGERFLAGWMTFGNGSVSRDSSDFNLSVMLDLEVFGSEFLNDSHPLLLYDTWRIQVRQTLNNGMDRVADADYIYFPDFPWVGSFRVFEDQTARVPLFAQFGSVEPFAFGAVDDPFAGVVLPSIIDDPSDPGATRPVEPVPDSPGSLWLISIVMVSLFIAKARLR